MDNFEWLGAEGHSDAVHSIWLECWLPLLSCTVVGGHPAAFSRAGLLLEREKSSLSIYHHRAQVFHRAITLAFFVVAALRRPRGIETSSIIAVIGAAPRGWLMGLALRSYPSAACRGRAACFPCAFPRAGEAQIGAMTGTR